VFKYMGDQNEALLRWVSWAEQEAATWPDDASRPDEPSADSALREATAS
jgi:hypothetical protein